MERVVVVSPRPARETLAAAHLAGVKEFYRVGGAQAVAALAYGTPSIPRVDKIVGPGNLYVTTAKKLVAFDCGIDMLAGPTEIVVASEDGNPQWIAADLVAQAEHDPETLAVLVTNNADLAKATAAEAQKQSASNTLARQALAKNGFIFITKNTKETEIVTNRLAAEHLTIDDDEDLSWVRHAGSIFVGTQTPQTMGDYVSGPNHVLPTGRLARVRGGLSIYDFLRLVTTQEYTLAGLAQQGPHAARLATAEGLLGMLLLCALATPLAERPLPMCPGVRDETSIPRRQCCSNFGRALLSSRCANTILRWREEMGSGLILTRTHCPLLLA